jgi:hypothetical protein
VAEEPEDLGVLATPGFAFQKPECSYGKCQLGNPESEAHLTAAVMVGGKTVEADYSDRKFVEEVVPLQAGVYSGAITGFVGANQDIGDLAIEHLVVVQAAEESGYL